MLDLATSLPPRISDNFVSLESKLQETIRDVKDLSKEFLNVYQEKEKYKSELTKHLENCARNQCHASEVLNKVLNEKNTIIELVGSSLTAFCGTKNHNIINHIFKILCGDTLQSYDNCNKQDYNQNADTTKYSPLESKKCDDLDISIRHNAVEDESMVEIEGTPTGRTSPILSSKPCITPNKESREKKKCSSTWPLPEKKSLKLSQTPRRKPAAKLSGRLKQQRLQLMREKSTTVVDLTSSPMESASNSVVNIKQEFIDSDETILPSPSSEVTHLMSRIGDCVKDNSKKVNLSIIKKENKSPNNLTLEHDYENKLDASINILGHLPKKSPTTPKKDILRSKKTLQDENKTYCGEDFNISMLNNVKMERQSIDYDEITSSPEKLPLAENINTTNIEANESISLLQQDKHKITSDGNMVIDHSSPEKRLEQDVKMEVDSSMSLLQREVKPKLSTNNNIKRFQVAPVEAIFKEPTVRKKAEKRALPGWSCEECRVFYDELYRDNPDMLAKKMDDCSKHRGKRNPVPAKPPANYWNPRWSVPEDTEEFNRGNNAV